MQREHAGCVRQELATSGCSSTGYMHKRGLQLIYIKGVLAARRTKKENEGAPSRSPPIVQHLRVVAGLRQVIGAE